MKAEVGGMEPLDLRTAVVRLAADGRVVHANTAAQHLLLGASPEGALIEDLLGRAEKLGKIASGTAGQIVRALASGNADATECFKLLDGSSILMVAGPVAGGTLVEWSDITPYVEAMRAQERDPLTGLLARPAMLREIAAMVQSGEPAALLYIGLDRFTSVNNMLGHMAGDKLLQKVSGRIVGLVPADAVMARVGGDEFAVLLRADSEAATAMAGRLLEMVARPFLIDGQSAHVGTSIGLAHLDPADPPENQLRNARLALLKAKADGGDAIQVFTDAMREELEQARLLEIDLRQALVLREFSLAYQPQYEIDGRRLIGFEALLRWHHPKRGPVSPAHFIPLAEELGLIVPIGEWVIRAACKAAAEWPLPLSISVNISPLQFRSPNIVAIVTSALKNSGLDPSRLELEVTEGALLLDSEPVMNIFRQLKALGLRFAMDDFGTGYSSLSYLQQFPFDKIKIDQSFVRNLPASPDGIAIVRAVSALGSSLGLSIIAEGVETEEQLASIRQNGCKQVQGYLTGRPLAPDMAEALIASAATAGEGKAS